MKQEINVDLKKVAEKIMGGDILNIPTLARIDQDRVNAYIFAIYREDLLEIKETVMKVVEDITELTELFTEKPSNKKKR